MLAILLVVAGFAALAGGTVALRRLGPAVRIAQLLGATRVVPVPTAIAIAERGEARYVAVRGRIESDEDFEDEHGRPLVFQRRRLQIQSHGRWTDAEDERRAVPFGVSEGTLTIAVDAGRLDEGVVVVARESEGSAGEIPDRVPAGTAAGTRVRLRVELVSSVDHAIVLGRPALDEAGRPIIGPGLGRPLVLTTLDPPEAMRLLAGDRRDTTRAATVLFASGLVLLVAGLVAAILGGLAAPSVALAASPSASASAVAGDPRSSGQGPGLVGDPLFAVALVVLIGALALAATLLYVRATARDAAPHEP